MSQLKVITKRNMLRLMDVRRKPDGRPWIFSVKFVQVDGKLRFFPQCTVSGAGQFSTQENRMRGLTPCDCMGNPEDHTHAVRIDNILEFNGQRVVTVLTDCKFMK